MEAPTPASPVRLKVAEAPPSDVGLGRARVDTKTRMALGVDVGGIVEIIGKKTTAATVFRFRPDDEGRGVVLIDGLVRKNAGVGPGDEVEVRKANVLPAKDVTMAPIISKEHKISFGAGIENFVRRGLLKRPLTKGDVVIVPGIALMGGALPFVVLTLEPQGKGQIIEDTVIHLLEKAVSEDAIHEPSVLVHLLVTELREALQAYDRGIEGLTNDLGEKTREARTEIRRILDGLEEEADRESPKKK